MRYSPKVNLGDHVTQPYDKITPQMRAAYGARSPHNLVHLILPDEARAAEMGVDKYTMAARLFRQWCAEGVLERDARPGFYPYRQTFELNGKAYTRTSFIGLCKVEDYSRKIIFPHERTLAKPKADRLSLLRAGRVHYGLIFFLYEDDGAAQSIIDRCMAAPAVATATDDYKVKNELWHLSDQAAVQSLSAALSDRQLFIADGHHRYETSLNYARENPRDEHAQYTVALFLNIKSDIVVLPTHRSVFGVAGYDKNELHRKLGESFDVKRLNTLDEVIAATNAPAGTVCIGGFDGSAFFSATLKGDGPMAKAMPAKPAEWRELDVAVLHTLVIERILGITPERVEQEAGVGYHRDPKEALEAVAGGRANCAFFLRATRPDQVCAVARKGEVMPQKSTDFYPKALSGLALYALDMQE
ncbi:DUF1015 domain-containing protein [bacterium]|nr:DUF1015 domain-containing protein [bacterium]